MTAANTSDCSWRPTKRTAKAETRRGVQRSRSNTRLSGTRPLLRPRPRPTNLRHGAPARVVRVSEPVKSVKIALFGPGTVGTQVVRLLTEHATDLEQRVGAPIEIVGIYVRDTSAPRDAVIDPALLTSDAHALIEDADLVVELMGGIEPARGYMLEAIGAGAAVVTANKALLA